MERIDIDEMEILLKGKYIRCSLTGSYHPAFACYKHSAGEFKNELFKMAIEERCVGCTRWVDVLEEIEEVEKREEEIKKFEKITL